MNGGTGLLAAQFAVVILAWGSNYPLIKLGVLDMSPLSFSAVRLLGGAVVLALMVRWIGKHDLRAAPNETLRLALSGLFQFGGVLAFAALGLQYLPSGRTVVAVYSMPLWAALLGLAVGQDRLTRRQWFGIIIGAAGLSLALDPAALGAHAGLGGGLVLAAAISWAIGGVIHRHRPLATPFLTQAFIQLLAAGCAIGLLALVLEPDPRIHVTSTLVLVTVWNWLVPTSIAVWCWSQVLQRMSTAAAGQVLMFTPMVGIVAGAIIFGESIPPIFLASALIMIAGTLLVLPRA